VSRLLRAQIASLPHVELEFAVPGKPGKRHKSLFLVDTGAGGAEVMFHSRAARELGLLDLSPHDKHAGWGQVGVMAWWKARAAPGNAFVERATHP
jgi:predicted aspartyl protease